MTLPINPEPSPPASPPVRRQWMREPIPLSTVVIAFATVVNLGVSIGLYSATKHTASVAQHVFEAANRPYVGVSDIQVVVTNHPDSLPVFRYNLAIKNFGTAAAEDMSFEYISRYNGMEVPRVAPNRRNYTLFPGVTAWRAAYVTGPTVSHILDGTSALELRVRVEYKGPGGKTYTYAEEYLYYPELKDFGDMGPIDK